MSPERASNANAATVSFANDLIFFIVVGFKRGSKCGEDRDDPPIGLNADLRAIPQIILNFCAVAPL